MVKNSQFLLAQILKKKSYLCVGIDPDIAKIPAHFLSEKYPYLAFAKAIIQATKNDAIAYKLNIAFFESLGPIGWEQLEMIQDEIPSDCLFIADAKRADIGNTSAMYAKYFFERLNADAITLHPYMGLDSIEPFMQYDNKWNIILALTSNRGSSDFELKQIADGRFLYELVLETFAHKMSIDQLMFVIGATHPDSFISIRKIVPDHFLLVPGIGAQGGDLESTLRNGVNHCGGLLINVGRSIIYPESITSDFEENVYLSCKSYQKQMANFMPKN